MAELRAGRKRRDLVNTLLRRAALEAMEGRVMLSIAPHVEPGLDFGDAPESYSTLLASNGPRHEGPSGLFLGTRWDAESDGHPSSNANGDDVNPLGQLDDEDGVTLPSPTPGTSGTVSVVSSGVGKLDGFIDFNADGDFADAGEKVFNSVSLTTGNNVLNYATPKFSHPGKTIARFRVSTSGGLSYNGAAADGEVEDHVLNIKTVYDYGDAPDSYGTLLENFGPRHALSPLFLGTYIDDETDGQPSDDASGDDFTPLGQPSDEDGISMPDLISGTDMTISVVSSGEGFLNAWIDTDHRGYFEYDSHVLHDVPVVAGNNEITLHVPEVSFYDTAIARFRLSSQEFLDPTGTAEDGEVEDYLVNFDRGTDFGDAPDSYHTLLASDGPRHKIGDGPSFGDVDAELDGRPTDNADGDDYDDFSRNDDSDVFIPTLVLGQEATIFPQVVGDGFIDAWIDLDGNGQFDAAEKVMDHVAASGVDIGQFPIQIPEDAKLGFTFARFRISSIGTPLPTGAAADGEVEDHLVEIVKNIDFGDAPDSYGTLATSNGPSHVIGSGPFLGDFVDAESDGQPSDGAGGDDFSGGDDEDGVFQFENVIEAGSENTVEVIASVDAKLDAFIDYNSDGDFDDAGEKVFDSVDVTAGVNYLTLNVPADAVAGQSTYTRFRISSAGGLGPNGPAPDGEVEDHAVYINPVPADLAITTLDAPKTVKPGATITYKITVNNFGPGDGLSTFLRSDLPENTTFVSATGPAGWFPELPSVGSDFGVIFFDRDTYAVSDGPQMFTITLRVRADAAPDSEIFNRVVFFHNENRELDISNNSVDTRTVVVKATPSDASGVSVVTDPADGSKKALKIVGTGSADKIDVLQSGSGQGKAIVKINGSTKGTFSFSGHIVVYGGGGNDTINIATGITRGAFVFGEGGNDVVNAGNGADVVVGGSGNDKLFGRGGRDLLFGGSGADSLGGGDADDILLAGSSDFDSNISSLAKLQKEWTRTDKDYATRVNNIKNGGGLNGTTKLTKTTADSTIASIDSLKGDAGSDLFLGNLVAASGKPKDLLQDKSGSETSLDLD